MNNIITTYPNKTYKSDDFNMVFNMETGFTAMWGKTTEDDPQVAPFPIILDMEVNEKCDGPNGSPCSFCYKKNTSVGRTMSVDTFKQLLDKFGNYLPTQIAFGSSATLEENPEIFEMMGYARALGVVPNITIANISDEIADKLAIYCGAVAVSRYDNKNWCYDSVKKLTDRGMTQINIHQIVMKESLKNIKETLHDRLNDERLSKLHAIVLLSLKQKGRGINHSKVTQDEFKEIVDISMNTGVSIGFDSCSAHKFLNSLSEENKKKYLPLVEPCESTCMSSYINVAGEFYPCSFTEGCEDFGCGSWKTGINVLEVKDFINDVWNNERVVAFRNHLLSKNRHCPIYDI